LTCGNVSDEDPKLGYYVCSSVALARRLRRRRDCFVVLLDPSRDRIPLRPKTVVRDEVRN
jgi:hypothetical protein